MRWKAKYTKAEYSNKTTRLKRKYAFLPVYIAGDMIWLETYEVLQAYIVEEVSVILENSESLVFFQRASWIDLSKRIIE